MSHKKLEGIIIKGVREDHAWQAVGGARDDPVCGFIAAMTYMQSSRQALTFSVIVYS